MITVPIPLHYYRYRIGKQKKAFGMGMGLTRPGLGITFIIEILMKRTSANVDKTVLK
jgi:hypothetical protein